MTHDVDTLQALGRKRIVPCATVESSSGTHASYRWRCLSAFSLRETCLFRIFRVRSVYIELEKGLVGE